MRMIPARGVVWGIALVILGALPAPAQTACDRAEVLRNGAYAGALQTQIRGAKRRIICAFYLFKITGKKKGLPAAISGELIRARQRGVEVTVILDAGKSSTLENRAAAGLLLQNGVSVRFPNPRRVTHLKAMVIDDRYVLIGSHNLTQAALAHNNELSVLLDSPQVAAEVTGYLEAIR